MLISQNKSDINKINEKRNISFSEEYIIDTINFINDDELTHEILGEFGYSKNFFIDMSSHFKVNNWRGGTVILWHLVC